MMPMNSVLHLQAHGSDQERLLAMADEYAGKILAAYPDAPPAHLTRLIAHFAPLAEASYRRRYDADPPEPMAAAVALAVDRLLAPTAA